MPAAVVFDLDGTLVRLAVDWNAAAEDAAAALRDRGVEPPGDLWAALRAGDEAGHRAAVEAAIAPHEREGARRSELLVDPSALPDGPVGVCSLNCEAACRIALERHGLAATVDAVVGRDTVATEKPDPEPLLETVRRLGVAPEETLFVGDTARDERTAEAAGTAFRYFEDWRRA